MIEGRKGKKGKMGDDKKIKERLGNGKGRERKCNENEKRGKRKIREERAGINEKKRHLIKGNVLSAEANEKTETKI